ncbi:head-tail adaptor protein [Tropicimonas sp. S265A]|uniref:head-tail adaptor protein n=1 Tax=Tropicimonas sp. S265A TaxID=3415134 RepID=UPI003C7A1D4D
MKAPRLTRPLTLEERQQTPDGGGGFVETWVPLGTLWAEVDSRSGRETGRRQAASVSLTNLRITVRAAPFGDPSRPKPEQRFRDGARIYRILAVADSDPLARYLICYSDEEVAG